MQIRIKEFDEDNIGHSPQYARWYFTTNLRRLACSVGQQVETNREEKNSGCLIARRKKRSQELSSLHLLILTGRV
jgi:hypothetical protein